MKWNHTYVALALAICSSCHLVENEKPTEQHDLTEFGYDTTVVAVLPFEATLIHQGASMKPDSLSKADFPIIDELLQTCIAAYNPEQEVKFNILNTEHPEFKLQKTNFIIDLSKYQRQYMSYIDTTGDRIVWVNCFCKTLENDWKNTPIVVADGGNCFFNVKINLTKQSYTDLFVNENS